ncbi:hypothetical protein D1007_32516 [Hordeum vulgare]|nr:hypothetical protein D1007_32516 [Hordeum vulgare]
MGCGGYRGDHSPPSRPASTPSSSLSPDRKSPSVLAFVLFVTVAPPVVTGLPKHPLLVVIVSGSSSKNTSSHGAWLGSEICEGHIEALRHRRMLPPASLVTLIFFGLQPHHLAPNAILQLSSFVVLCEGFLGIEPSLDLWQSLFFLKQQSKKMDKAELEKLDGPRPMTPCGAALVHHRSKSVFPQMPLQESIKQW